MMRDFNQAKAAAHKRAAETIKVYEHYRAKLGNNHPKVERWRELVRQANYRVYELENDIFEARRNAKLRGQFK